MRVCVLSDLHVFCGRSRAESYSEAIDNAIGRADRCVLAGDIFDFRWTVYPTIEETAEQAVRWLDSLVKRFPQCHFHYVLGNHDCVQAFLEVLLPRAEELPNLDIHEHGVRIGDTLVIHGDAVHRLMTHADYLEFRRRWRTDQKKGPWINRLYSLSSAIRFTQMLHRLAFPTSRTLDRLLAYLDAVGEGPETGVRTVCFGHTHLAIHNRLHRGVCFHNAGAAMPGLRFGVIELDIEAGPDGTARPVPRLS